MNIALDDVKKTLKLAPAALFLTWSDTKARYRRSMLGPFWLVLGTGIGVAGLGFLWSALLKMDRETFIPSLTVGLIVWQLIAGCVTESSGVFVRNSMVVRNLKIPFLFFPLQLVLRQTINFGHNLVVILVVLLIFPPPLSAVQLLLIPGFVLLIGNLLWLTMIVGMVGARFRDIEPLIGAFMPMLFFLSPVIYRPDHLGIHAQIAWLNPFSYFISLIRDPIQGVMPPMFVYGVATAMLIAGWLFTLQFLGRKYGRVPFWV